METTLCWNCNTVYSIEDEKLPSCGSTNANFDQEQAQIESLKDQNTELLRALESIPTSCDHEYPHLLACWHCIVKDAIAKHENQVVK